jgi:hypothetical protein
MSNRTKFAVFILILIGISLPALCFFGATTMVGALLLFSPVESHYLPLSPTVESRNISQEYGDKLIWSRNNIHMLHTSAPSPGLLVGYGYVAFAKFLDNSGNRVYQLDVLDADTGETLWQSELFPSIQTPSTLVLGRIGWHQMVKRYISILAIAKSYLRLSCQVKQ